MAEKIDNIHQRPGSLGQQLAEVHRVVVEIAGQTTQIPAMENPTSRPPSSLKLDMSQQTSPHGESFSPREFFPPLQSSKTILAARSPPLTVTEGPSSPRPASPASTSPASTARKRISDFNVEGSTIRYSGSYASSDTGISSEWHSPTITSRNSYLSRQPSTSKRESKLPMTPELPEPRSRPDSTALPSLPPPAIELPEDRIEKAISISKLSLHPPTEPEITKLHRSSTTSSQKDLFEKQAFRNSAILCDV